MPGATICKLKFMSTTVIFIEPKEDCCFSINTKVAGIEDYYAFGFSVVIIKY